MRNKKRLATKIASLKKGNYLILDLFFACLGNSNPWIFRDRDSAIDDLHPAEKIVADQKMSRRIDLVEQVLAMVLQHPILLPAILHLPRVRAVFQRCCSYIPERLRESADAGY